MACRTLCVLLVVLLGLSCTLALGQRKIISLRELFEMEQEYLSRSSGIHKRAANVCYDKLGCFDNQGEWGSRFFSLLPIDPKNMGLSFLLFTRANPVNSDILDYADSSSIKASHFDSSKKTVVVCHGFIESAEAMWFQSMNKELLSREDVNVINVNWGGFGGSKTLYTQATANTRVVGAALGVLIEEMMATVSADPSKFHLVGHSLGSHIIGYAGTHVAQIKSKPVGRITGLDPAEPYFEEYGPNIRLDPTDANFVDVIHSDGESIYGIATGSIGGFGMAKPCGHADFYPNGGEEQPGCEQGLLTQVDLEDSIYGGIKQYVACDHIRAVRFFNQSINACAFTGYGCSDYDTFKGKACPASCNGNSCNEMGYKATKPQANQKYFLMTGGRPPFCARRYNLVTIKLTKDTAKLNGNIYIRLIGDGDVSSEPVTLALDGSQDEFEVKLVWQSNPAPIKYVGVEWDESLPWWRPVTKFCQWINFCSGNIAGISKAEVLDYSTQTKLEFCGGEVPEGQSNGEGMRLLPSDYC